MTGQIYDENYAEMKAERARRMLAGVLGENAAAAKQRNTETFDEAVTKRCKVAAVEAGKEIVKTQRAIEESWATINEYKDAVKAIDDACIEKLAEIEQDELRLQETTKLAVETQTLKVNLAPFIAKRNLVQGRMRGDPNTGYRMHENNGRPLAAARVAS